MLVYFLLYSRAPHADDPYLFFLEPNLSKQMLSNNNIANQIPILDGSNYGAWSKVMCAFIRAQGLWQIVNGNIDHPDEMLPTDGTAEQCKANAVAIIEWDKQDDMAIGHITLCISPSIQEDVAKITHSSEVWEHLENKYGLSMPTTIYQDFKEAC
jgi:hypothetical protein